MKRVYSNPSFESDLAGIIHGKDSCLDGLSKCPCCGCNTSEGEHAQAMYYSLIDDVYNLLIDENEFRKSKAATNLISRLNQMINTSTSIGLDKSSDGGTAKVKRINIMIKNLLEVRE